jgi:hypothetical protein
MPCPSCGMDHEDPQPCRGRCLRCPCVAELRSQIANLEMRQHQERRKRKPSRKSPAKAVLNVCDHCGAEHMSSTRCRWCPVCRPECYHQAQQESHQRVMARYRSENKPHLLRRMA